MKIISLEASNILRLEAIQIQCDGKNVTLSGANTTGKTSVLKCISMALGGKDEIPDEPIHRGAKKGKIDLDLGEFKIKRTFTEGGGGTLTVSAKDGAKYPSPQSVLDGLVGQLTFDPLAFTRLDAKKQAETLRNLVGLDFTKIDAEYKAVFEKRTIVNREIANKEAQLNSQASFPDAPAEELTVEAFIEQLTDASLHNGKLDTLKTQAKAADDAFVLSTKAREAKESRIKYLEAEITNLHHELDADAEPHQIMDRVADELAAKVDAFVAIDVAPIRLKLSTIEETNRKVRQNKTVKVIKEALRNITADADRYTDELDALLAEKESLLASAQMPVPGLSFTDKGVLYNNLPFEQSSAAEQLRVSAAMGMALNPTLRVLMIRDASLIDDEGMQALAALAEDNDFQLWLERVSSGKEVKVVIEEGEAK